MLIAQNEFIKIFSIQNDISDHLKIHIIKPLRNKPTTFQVFASVSPTLRDGLRRNKDKIVIGSPLAKCMTENKQVDVITVRIMGILPKVVPPLKFLTVVNVVKHIGLTNVHQK